MVSFKINQEYIAANLCINRFEAIPVCKGSCFLEKQINQDKKQQQNFPDLKLKVITLFCQDNISDILTHTKVFQSRVVYPSLNTAFVSSAYLRSVFRPPVNIV